MYQRNIFSGSGQQRSSSHQLQMYIRDIHTSLMVNGISMDFINGVQQLAININAEYKDVDIFFRVPFESMKVFSQYPHFLGIAQLYYRFQLSHASTKRYFHLLAMGRHCRDYNAYHLFRKLEQEGFANSLYNYFEPYSGQFLNYKSKIIN